jgi:WD40 repeat protein
MGGEDSKSVCEAVLIDLHGKVIRKFEGHRWGINQVEFSSDGERLATAGWDGAVRVWHVASAREICRHQHDSQVMSLSFRSDGQQIASGDWNRTIRIWDASTGQVLRSLRGHSEGIRSVSFSPDGRMLATGSFDKTVRIFDLTSQTEPVTLRSHQRFVASLAFSPDGTRLVSFGGEWPQDKPTEMILWNANSSGLIWSQIGQPMQPSQIAFSADGEQIAHVSGQMTAQGEITICSAASGRVIHVVKTPKIATSLVFSRDGKRLVVGGVDKIVRIVDPVSGKVVQEIVRPHGIGRIALMPDGRRLAVCTDALLGGANGVYLYDLQTGVEVRICSEGVDTMAPIALNASGDLLAVGFKDATVRLFDLKTNQEILKLQGHTDTATDICFSPDGNRIATGSNDRTVKLWDAATGDVLLTLRGHSDTVTTVMFSPDGLRLATGSMDRTIRIWNATPE